MKILHAILSQGFYGSERYCIELATAQARSGHQVQVLIQDSGSDCARAFRQAIKSATQSVAEGRMPGGIGLTVIPRSAPAFLHRPFARHALARFSPDIVHTHLNPAARRVGRVARGLGIPHVATLHVKYDPREHGPCDGLIAIAAWQRGQIPAEFRGETTVVWNWLSAAVRGGLARTTAADVAVLRESWRVDRRTVVFGSIGRLMTEKGMDRLVRCFRHAFPRGDEPVALVIIGDGPLRSEVERLSWGDARIVLIGPQAEIAPFYRAFDVYVSAAAFEPFGLTILEAMAAGCPLVLTRAEGPREFVKDAQVLWAEPDDDALAAQLSAAAKRGRYRLDYDLSPFAPERAMAAIEAFYRKVLARKGVSA